MLGVRGHVPPKKMDKMECNRVQSGVPKYGITNPGINNFNDNKSTTTKL